MPHAKTSRTGARLALLAFAATSLVVVPTLAEAQRVRGGARSSVSRPSGGSFSGSRSMSSRPSAGTRPATGARTGAAGSNLSSGSRTNVGASDRMANSGNRVNTGDRVNGGNRVNNGNINTGDINRGDINIDADNGWGNGNWDWDDRPIGAGIAFGAAAAVTAAAIGSMMYTLPYGCSPYPYSGYSYYSCGGVYYEPQYQGDTVVYVVVDEPK